jgi:hypothetical protein
MSDFQCFLNDSLFCSMEQLFKCSLSCISMLQCMQMSESTIPSSSSCYACNFAGLFGHHAFSRLPVEIGFLFWLCYIFGNASLISWSSGHLSRCPWYAIQLHIMCTYLNQLFPVCASALLTSHASLNCAISVCRFLHFTFLVIAPRHCLPLLVVSHVFLMLLLTALQICDLTAL